MAAFDTADRIAIALVAMLSIGAGVWLLVDAQPSVGASATALDSCATIDDPGRYVLAADIVDSEADTCIRIRSDDVVLEGDGRIVDGVGRFGTAGVVVRPAAAGPLSNVTVRNVTVTDWDDGLRYVTVVDGRVTGVTAADNRVGVGLLDTRDTELADTVARGNRLRGISVFESSANNTLSNNTATGNAVFGIHLVESGVRNNTLVGNTASDNEFGIVLIGAHDNTLIRNTARSNHIAGIWLSAAAGNELRHNAVANRFYGIFLADRSNGNVIADTTAVSNTVGIRLRSSDDTVVANNHLRGSDDAAILLISTRNTTIVDNAGSNNARGIVLVRSTGVTRANNTVDGGEPRRPRPVVRRGDRSPDGARVDGGDAGHGGQDTWTATSASVMTPTVEPASVTITAL